MAKADERQRVWCCEVYPESAIENWMQKLEDLHIAAFVSPLHEHDTQENGEPKKPHYHIMFMAEGKKSKDQRQEMIDAIGAVAPSGGWIPPSTRGYARYLCHLDTPSKYKYDTDQVRSFGGANYQTTINLSDDRYSAVREMKDWCKTNEVYYYSDLLDYAAAQKEEWFRALCDNSTMVMINYIKSLKYKHDQQTQIALQEEETKRHIELLKTLNAQIEKDKILSNFLTNLSIEDDINE